MLEWNATKKEREKISAIYDRAAKEIESITKIDFSMDIEATHSNGCPLDLGKLLSAKDSDFFHDVYGIINCLDRNTGKLKDCFLPRCSLPEKDQRG